MTVRDYRKLAERLRLDPLDSTKAALPIYDLCIDAAQAIEDLLQTLEMAQGERDVVTKHMIELEEQNTALHKQIDNLTDAQAVVVKQFDEKLEELAKASSRGLFDFAEIVSGLPSLPEGAACLEPCFASLGFSRRPESAEKVQSRYRQLAKAMHPDAGGDADAFQLLRENYRKCLELMEGEVK